MQKYCESRLLSAKVVRFARLRSNPILLFLLAGITTRCATTTLNSNPNLPFSTNCQSSISSSEKGWILVGCEFNPVGNWKDPNQEHTIQSVSFSPPATLISEKEIMLKIKQKREAGAFQAGIFGGLLTMASQPNSHSPAASPLSLIVIGGTVFAKLSSEKLQKSNEPVFAAEKMDGHLLGKAFRLNQGVAKKFIIVETKGPIPETITLCFNSSESLCASEKIQIDPQLYRLRPK